MRRLTILAAVAGLVALLPSSAPAARLKLSFGDALRLVGNVEIPQEWDGVWVSEDSLFDCTGGLREVEAGSDTLCGGTDFATLEEGLPFVPICTGFADANSADVTCTGILPIAEDCDLVFFLHIVATRNGENAVADITQSMTYDGAGLGCDFLPDECTRTKSIAMRASAAPSDYCSTPTLPSTLGRIKVQYR